MFGAIEIIARSFLTKLAELTKEAFDGSDESSTHYHIFANRSIGAISPYVVAEALHKGKFGRGSFMRIITDNDFHDSHDHKGRPDPSFHMRMSAVLEQVSKEAKVSPKKAKEEMYWPRDHTWEIALPKQNFKNEEHAYKQLDKHGTEKAMLKYFKGPK